jgi:Vitamin K-dependent gamma-carboxylase
LNSFFNKIIAGFFLKQIHIAPLAVLRMVFGAVMFISTLRFILKGWVHDFYIVPKFHFPFYGFEWIQPLGPTGMYVVYGCMAVAALFIAIGFFYRVASIVFFLCFCYTGLIDKTYYLNHYYLVSILAFLLILTPANRYFSADVMRNPGRKVTYVPAWTITIFKLQLCIIYFFAGLSKLTWDWLFNAMPLRIWLPASSSLPLIGSLLSHEWVAYFFSWAAALFDLSIAFLLLGKTTRVFAYCFVIVFHLLTAAIFQIGMFPYIMIAVTTVFFPEAAHKKIIQTIRSLFFKKPAKDSPGASWRYSPVKQKLLCGILVMYFFVQILLPLRFLLFPGNLLWTEEGYRFSWRVMLMEKGGTTFFYVKNPANGRKFEINNAQFITAYQERMMETQPDMILQYAHILKEAYKKQGIEDPVVTVECYVALNGTGSRLYIDSTVNLANEKESLFGHKKWILPFVKQ